MVSAERQRLGEGDRQGIGWRRWGPYLSERQWGTVREDGSDGGDVVVEYAKATPEDLLMRVTVHNRGPDNATLHMLPTLWFRHTWSWARGDEHPEIRALADVAGRSAATAEHTELGRRRWYADRAVPVLVTGNETNNERVFGSANDTRYVKDGIDRAVVHGDTAAVDPSGVGTKAPAHYVLQVPAGGGATVRMRFTDRAASGDPFLDFGAILHSRRAEADEFWADVLSGLTDEHLVGRQALAGMPWSRQYYALDVERWLSEHAADPLAAASAQAGAS